MLGCLSTHWDDMTRLAHLAHLLLYFRSPGHLTQNGVLDRRLCSH
jgi:hypothetical protein